MTTVIVDYGSGNLRSAEKALVRAAEGRAMAPLSEAVARFLAAFRAGDWAKAAAARIGSRFAPR